MPSVPQARQARPGGSLAPTSFVLPLLLALACGDGSLDAIHPAPDSTTGTGDGGTLPPIDTGEPSSTGEASSTGETNGDDPRMCPTDCYVDLPVDWTYHGVPADESGESEPPDPTDDPRLPPPFGFDPRGHRVPVLLRDPDDGSLLVGEQHDGAVTLHKLDRDGQLQWNVPVPLPCDRCELGHIAAHPSGDLLLSATGLLIDGDFSLFAARYDPRAHVTRWVTSTPLEADPEVPVRAGEIAVHADSTVAQLFLRRSSSVNPLQSIWLVAYDDDGTPLEFNPLDVGLPLSAHRPILARISSDDRLVVALPAGQPHSPYGLVGHLLAPLWSPSSFFSVPFALDDLRTDARGHTLELSHTFEGQRIHLVLGDRVGAESEPRWITSAVFDSISEARVALAVGPDGEAYAALRTEQALAPDAEPLVGLSMARWTTDGELRWQLTRLERLEPDLDSIRLAIDDTDGLIIATVVDDQLRVERREQGCGCG